MAAIVETSRVPGRERSASAAFTSEGRFAVLKAVGRTRPASASATTAVMATFAVTMLVMLVLLIVAHVRISMMLAWKLQRLPSSKVSTVTMTARRRQRLRFRETGGKCRYHYSTRGFRRRRGRGIHRRCARGHRSPKHGISQQEQERSGYRGGQADEPARQNGIRKRVRN